MWESYKSPAVVYISRVRSKGVFNSKVNSEVNSKVFFLCLPMLRDSQAHNWVQGSTCNQTFNTDNFLLVTFWDSYMFICIPDVFHPFKMLAFIEKVSTFVNIVNVILYVLNQKDCKRHSFLPWKETTLCKRFQPFHIINVILYVHQIKKSQCCTTLHCRRQHFTPWKEPNLYKRFMLLILKKDVPLWCFNHNFNLFRCDSISSTYPCQSVGQWVNEWVIDSFRFWDSYRIFELCERVIS